MRRRRVPALWNAARLRVKMSREIITRFPWEPVPVEEQLDALRRDVAIMVTHTCVDVQSSNPAIRMSANVERTSTIPHGEATLSDGTTVEFRNTGMPRPGVPFMTIEKLIENVLEAVSGQGLSV